MNNIKLFQDKKIRSVWNEEEEQWYFSVVDVVEALTDSSDPKQYIKKMRTRDPLLNTNWGTICTLVQMPALDGKSRKIMASDIKGLFRLIQSIRLQKLNHLNYGYPRLVTSAYLRLKIRNWLRNA